MAEMRGAGEGNRTLVISLEGFCSTIELHPHFNNLAAPRLSVLQYVLQQQRCRAADCTLQSGWSTFSRFGVAQRNEGLHCAHFSHAGPITEFPKAAVRLSRKVTVDQRTTPDKTREDWLHGNVHIVALRTGSYLRDDPTVSSARPSRLHHCRSLIAFPSTSVVSS